MSPSEAVAFYRLYAGHCIEMSRHMSDLANKTTLIAMAQAWLTLAEQVEKYGETALANETPSPRSQSQQVTQQQQPSQPDDPGKKHGD